VVTLINCGEQLHIFCGINLSTLDTYFSASLWRELSSARFLVSERFDFHQENLPCSSVAHALRWLLRRQNNQRGIAK
jgi:hypothetical protein